MTDGLRLQMTSDQLEFWQNFQLETGRTDWPRDVDGFGDNPEMMDALLSLVLKGQKKATATLARMFKTDPLGLPRPGDLWLIIDGQHDPACIVETTHVDVCPVKTVGAEFAYIEGEGDRSLNYWLTEHRKYWQREATREGFLYSDNLDVVCEQFELIWYKKGQAISSAFKS